MAANDMTTNLWAIPGFGWNPLVTNDVAFVMRDVMKAACTAKSSVQMKIKTIHSIDSLVDDRENRFLASQFHHSKSTLLLFFLSSHRRVTNWIKSLLRRRRETLETDWHLEIFFSESLPPTLELSKAHFFSLVVLLCLPSESDMKIRYVIKAPFSNRCWWIAF